ncbi:uncharacterized protein LOC134247528, partial [Saccostrea cucullata]|uniref:uncharacterized protein LOC134247528 n=1 Tax=Saccostrea cuccullata TaxID=36930 RepID=UPI002ED63181
PRVRRNPATNKEASRSQQRRNEDVAINRNSRGVASENSGRMKAFLRCKETTSIVTYNVNTLLDEDKRWELQHCRHWQYIGILGVQEHHIIHSDHTEYTKFDTSTLVTSSGWRNKSQATQDGVGLLLERKAKKISTENGSI